MNSKKPTEFLSCTLVMQSVPRLTGHINKLGSKPVIRHLRDGKMSDVDEETDQFLLRFRQFHKFLPAKQH